MVVDEEGVVEVEEDVEVVEEVGDVDDVVDRVLEDTPVDEVEGVKVVTVVEKEGPVE